MRNLSRRGFFKKVGEAALDHTHPSENKSIIEPKPSGEIPLGRLSEFPPGEERSFSCRGGSLVVTSLAAGIRAEWRVNSEVFFVPLHLRRGGELTVDLNQVCGRTAVLSLMTGEMTEIE